MESGANSSVGGHVAVVILEDDAATLEQAAPKQFLAGPLGTALGVFEDSALGEEFANLRGWRSLGGDVRAGQDGAQIAQSIAARSTQSGLRAILLQSFQDIFSRKLRRGAAVVNWLTCADCP